MAHDCLVCVICVTFILSDLGVTSTWAEIWPWPCGLLPFAAACRACWRCWWFRSREASGSRSASGAPSCTLHPDCFRSICMALRLTLHAHKALSIQLNSSGRPSAVLYQVWLYFHGSLCSVWFIFVPLSTELEGVKEKALSIGMSIYPFICLPCHKPLVILSLLTSNFVNE